MCCLSIGDQPSRIPLTWVEIYSTAEGRWVGKVFCPVPPGFDSDLPVDTAVDCIRGKVDDPYSLDPPVGSPNPLSYVVAFQQDEMVKDVSRRYAAHWGARTKRMRMPDIFWWNKLLDHYALRKGKNYDRIREEWEDSELEARESTEILPKTMDEFKNHPLYVLERHLKKTECIKSKETILGHFRGEPVFPRGSVKILRSLPAWLKQARVVMVSQETKFIVGASSFFPWLFSLS